MPSRSRNTASRPYRLVARRRDELHASRHHALIGGLEVIHAEKQPDAASELLADDGGLAVAVSACQEDTRVASAGSHDDPALRAAIVGQRRRVFHQLELQHVDEEADRGIVVLHHEGDEFKIRHQGSDYNMGMTNDSRLPRRRHRKGCRFASAFLLGLAMIGAGVFSLADAGGTVSAQAPNPCALLKIDEIQPLAPKANIAEGVRARSRRPARRPVDIRGVSAPTASNSTSSSTRRRGRFPAAARTRSNSDSWRPSGPRRLMR